MRSSFIVKVALMSAPWSDGKLHILYPHPHGMKKRTLPITRDNYAALRHIH
jgi:hypothetical protein